MHPELIIAVASERHARRTARIERTSDMRVRPVCPPLEAAPPPVRLRLIPGTASRDEVSNAPAA